MYKGLIMKKLFLRTMILVSVLTVLGIFKSNPVQAQCFYLGQAFECNGLPEGTEGVSTNPDGTINLSNGQIVPGDFFNTPFRVTGLDVAPSDLVRVTPRPPITFFPTTADGINALTAFSHALEGADVGIESSKYKGSLSYYLATTSFGRHDIKVSGEEFKREQKKDKIESLGGIEFEVARSVSLGVRYIHRAMPQVLDDPNRPVVPYDARYTKQALEYGIDQMDSNAAPVPNLPSGFLNQPSRQSSGS